MVSKILEEDDMGNSYNFPSGFNQLKSPQIHSEIFPFERYCVFILILRILIGFGCVVFEPFVLTGRDGVGDSGCLVCKLMFYTH